MQPLEREYRSAPSALAFMARAIITPARPGLKAQPPAIAAKWRGHRVAGGALEQFLDCTGLRRSPHWPVLYPHVTGFRLQMAVLTDRRFPLPIWNSLQTRNRLVLHRPFDRGAALDFETRVAEQRVVEKGAEIDLRTTVHAAGELAWESINTFYYRGRFGASGDASPPAVAPDATGADIARWRMDTRGGGRFSALTGDYNGIHLFRGYARLFGFRNAFLHPQRVLGQCLARLPRLQSLPARLDVWLKGPVYYGAEVLLRADGGSFALYVNGDARAAIVGRLYA